LDSFKCFGKDKNTEQEHRRDCLIIFFCVNQKKNTLWLFNTLTDVVAEETHAGTLGKNA